MFRAIFFAYWQLEMRLFTVNGDVIAPLSAGSFQAVHNEERIQSWADKCPALLNDGQLMLSLGTEIVTRHNHYIDNLFLDGNGTLVAAEMKRGRTPRDVVAQSLDYAAYVSTLDWPDIERYCLRRHGKALDEAFQALFGRPLDRSVRPNHRLLIVAESYDPRVNDAALYLINGGMRLALLQFTLYDLVDRCVLDLSTVLGEIPAQALGPQHADAPPGAPDLGYDSWLIGSLAQELPGIATAQGWPLRFRQNKQSLPFGSETWPLGLGDCQLRADVFSKHRVALCMYFRKEAAPGLQDFIEARKPDWAGAFPATFASPTYATSFANLLRELPRPELGDAGGLQTVTNAVTAMAQALVPVVSAYFSR